MRSALLYLFAAFVATTTVCASEAETLTSMFEDMLREDSSSPGSPIHGVVTENTAKINMGLVPQGNTDTMFRTSGEVAQLLESSRSTERLRVAQPENLSRSSSVRTLLRNDRSSQSRRKLAPIVDFHDCSALSLIRGRGSAQQQAKINKEGRDKGCWV